MANVFAKKTVPPAAEVAESGVTLDDMATITQEPNTQESKNRKPRKSPNRQKTKDEVKFIIENWRSMSTAELANQTGLTKQQVYRTIVDTKKTMQKKAEQDPSQAEKINKFIETYLPSKAENIGHGGGGRKGSVLDDVLNDLLG
jgi:predicted HTH transcriptional regulator